jgi:uncharacterized DUF497 family protein
VIVLPNPEKEARNRAKHGWGFERVADMFTHPLLDEPDDRPFGYEHGARMRALGRIGARVVVLAFEPVEIESGDLAVRPISLRDATRAEERAYWRRMG